MSATAQGPAGEPVEWSLERLGELSDLCAVALPDESLSADDLGSVCFAEDLGDPEDGAGVTVVFGTPSGSGALVVSLRPRVGDGTEASSELTAFVQLLVVHPARRRRGTARALLAAAERWAVGRGASSMQVGAAAPLYLFSGVDSRWTEALCCFEALGYERLEVLFDLTCPTRSSSRAPAPPGIGIARVDTDADVADLVAWSRRCWPGWTTEFRRAGEAGTAVIARSDDRAVVGAAAHSVGRLGVVGPVAVEPDLLQGGIGSALMSAVLADLSVAGLSRAEIAWVSTVRFYATCCGARVQRCSQVLGRRVGPAAVDL